jgi:hypothetical protein
MKQAIQPGADVAQKTAAEPVRSWRSQQQVVASDGRLAQLAATLNSSPGSKALAQLKEDMQHGPQGLTGLAVEINQSAPAQLRGIAVNDDAGLEHEADVMGAKALAVQRQPATDDAESFPGASLGNAKIHNNSVQQGTDAPVQRVRILLKDEDPDLMARLRLVPVANPGAATLQNPDNVGTLAQIGANESIILEGHGYMNNPLFGARQAVSQGGIPPARLAAVVRGVPKPLAWAGNVVLLGCSTGDITAAVSEEYFKLTGTTVKVIGTRAGIRVGTKEDGTVFVGHDWSEQPVNERPADLAFVGDLRAANGAFSGYIRQLSAFCRALSQNSKGVATPLPYTLTQLEARGNYIDDVDNLSAHKATAVHGRRYAKPARNQMGALFGAVLLEIGNVSFFRAPDTILPIADPKAAVDQVTRVLVVLKKLGDDEGPIRLAVEHELLGYTLKEVDLSSNVSAKHSKRRRTQVGIFSDTWVDEP